MKVLKQPSAVEAHALIQEAVRDSALLLIIGKCKVEYVGRASSKLGLGDRLVVCKPDGSLLVHRPVGYEPVNWMPAGSYLLSLVEEGGLCLRSVRRKPFEELRVCFNSIYLAIAAQLIDEGEFAMYASEEDMRRAILIKPSIVEEGFKPYVKEKRLQLEGGEGYADLVGEDEVGNLVVIEVKRARVDRGAVLQLKQYVDALALRTPRRVRGIIVGPSITKEASTLARALSLDFKPLNPREAQKILREAGEGQGLLRFT